MRAQKKPLFFRTGAVNPGRSVFDLSYQKLLDCDMGQLIPIMCDEVIPGDVWEIGNEIVIRFQPMVAPILHEINVYVHYFFVPYRLLWPEPEGWQTFITGGFQGTDSVAVLPRWSPINNAKGSLWDYLGFPPGIVPLGALPLQFPQNAYNFIYNTYYKDETLISDVSLTQESILLRAWEKDYFTSSLPWQQRGTAPALPISGTTNAVFNGATPQWLKAYVGQVVDANHDVSASAASSNTTWTLNRSSGSVAVTNGEVDAQVSSSFVTWLNNNSINLANATTFNVKDLRLAFSIQRWMEHNARGGARYTEFLQQHFGVAPRDDRLQRPEYIGGSKSPVIISEVLQTSASNITGSTTPTGTLNGHGITVDRSYVAKYHAEEFGLIMGIMSVMPKPVYSQGINRQWLRQTKYDFPFPEFVNLSEQAILQAEIYADGVSTDNNTIFGYQGRYDELRYKPNMFVADMRDTYNYWHLGRIFSAAPLLNQSFIECNGTTVAAKRPFAVQNVPELIVSVGNRIKAIRPLPIMAQPGLIDHDDRI